jgi:enoyl-CoA hydratase
MSKLSAKTFEEIEVTVGNDAERVATITIDRPEKRNALNQTVRSEIPSALDYAEEDDSVRTVVITGSKESSTFAAGADISELRERDAMAQREASKRPRVYDAVYECSLPVIARINGHALGGGCELAQACDVRIAQSGSKLGQPEINLGIIPGGGGTQRLSRLVGTGHAMRLILSGEMITADEAADIGLVDEVHEESEFDQRVYSLAGKMASKSPIALSHAKQAVQASDRLDLDAGLDRELDLFTALFDTADKNEGIDAFFEDREPEFTGE